MMIPGREARLMTKKSFYVEALKQQFYTCKVMAENEEDAHNMATGMWAKPSWRWTQEQEDELSKGIEKGTYQDWELDSLEILDIGLDRGTVWCGECYEQGKEDTCTCSEQNHKCTPDNHVGTCDDCMTKED